jgi:hypothetical protein
MSHTARFVRIGGVVWLVVVPIGFFLVLQSAVRLASSPVDASDYGIGDASGALTLFVFAGCLAAGTGFVIAMLAGRLRAVFALLGLYVVAVVSTWSRADVPIGIWLRGLAWALPVGAGLLALARVPAAPVEQRLRTVAAVTCMVLVLVVGGGLAWRDAGRDLARPDALAGLAAPSGQDAAGTLGRELDTLGLPTELEPVGGPRSARRPGGEAVVRAYDTRLETLEADDLLAVALTRAGFELGPNSPSLVAGRCGVSLPETRGRDR